MWMLGGAQQVAEGEMAVLYFAPKTEVSMLFRYTVEVQEAGRFCRYAEQLLGVKDAVQETTTTYTLDGVEIGRRTHADTTRVRKIVAEPSMPTQLLTLDKRGLIEGYNLRTTSPAKPKEPEAAPAPVTVVPEAAPLTEEELEQPDEESRARAVAKQIYRIRESRMFLLSGEVDHAPADGQAMQLVLQQMQAEEKQLVALFVGSRTTRKEQHEVGYTPGKQDDERLVLYFSEENGFTEAENLEADSIVVTLKNHRQLYAEEEQPKKKAKNAPQPSQLIYNLPGSSEVTVTYRGKELGSKTLPVAQLGIDVPLTRDLFTGQKLPVIRFDVPTGNIQSIAQ